MVNNQNEAKNINRVILSVVLVGITLILGVIIFDFLSTADNKSLGNEVSERVVFSVPKERLNVPNNAICVIKSITDLNGNTISSSNYTINNCEVTYSP